MYRNILKQNATCLKEEETRIIDSNALLKKKLGSSALRENRNQAPEPSKEEGFSPGLKAEEYTEGAVLGDVSGEEVMPELSDEEAQQRTEAVLEEARQQAAAEIEQMRAEAKASLQTEREQVLKEARTSGYQEGYSQGMEALEEAKQEFAKQQELWTKEYNEKLDEMEPQLVDTLTGIYEHVFHVELSGYRDLILYLISTAIRKTEGGRDMIIHVSKEDYPYVNMQKKQITAGVLNGSNSIEVIEDMTLSKNQAMIETDSGIFDCSLGTQLSELGKKLKLLSYEKPAGD